MTIDPLIRRKLLAFSLKPALRALVAVGALTTTFTFMSGPAQAQSIPNGPENFQAQTDWVDQSPSPLTLGHIYRSFGDPDEDADIGMGKGWMHSWSGRLKLPKYYNAKYAASIAIVLPDGTSALFLKDDGEQAPWLPATGADFLLGSVGNAWQYHRASDNSIWKFDNKGWLTQVTLRNGWNYNILQTNGKVLSVANSFGRGLGFSYRTDGRLGSVTLPDGNAVNYDYNAKGSLSSVKVNSYQTHAYSYGNITFPGLVTAVGDAQGNQILGFSYNPDGSLKETTRAGVTGAYRVSYAGAASVGSAGMLVAAGTDDPNWYKASVTTTDPNGNSITRQYQGTASGVRLVGQNNARFWDKFKEELNTDLLPASKEDFQGNKTTYQWNTNRQLITQVVAASNRPEAQTTQIEWHDAMSLPTKITEAGRITQLSYDDGGNLVGTLVTDTASGKAYSSAWAYNPNGLPYSYTDAGGQTVFGYDTKGNLNKVTDPQGRISQYTHDGAGRILTATDPSGLVRSYSYNPKGQLTSFSAGGLLTTLSYMPNDKLGTVTFANGYAITYQYDGALRTSNWSDNRGNSGQYTLDAQDNATSATVKDSAANTALQVQRSINGINRVTRETIGGNQTTSMTYDANGDLTTVYGGPTQTTTFAVDGLRRLNKITDPLNNTATLTYNQLDAITSAKDFKGVTTSYTRDALGNAKQEVTPDAGTGNATYDVRGLLASTTDATDRTIGVERDALGRITKINYNNGTSSVLRYDLTGTTYNTAAAPNASIGHLSEVQDPGVTTQYQRDALGRVLRKTQILAGGETRSIAYSYVPAGQGGAGSVQSITYPSGKQLAYQYDSTGLITGMQWNGTALLSGLTWNPLGMPKGWSWPGILAAPGATAKLAEARSYNTAGQLTHTGILDLTWDAAGRVSAIEQSQMVPAAASAGGAATTTVQARIASAYTYDAAGRLIASGHSLKSTPTVNWPRVGTLATNLLDVAGYNSIGYAYDANGNRLSASINKNPASSSSTTTIRAYSLTAGTNVLASITSVTNPGGVAGATKTYQYDAAGAITSATTSGATGGAQYLHYGANGRVAKVTGTASSTDPSAVSYLYNSASQRLLKTDARQSTTAPRTEHTLYSEEDSAQLLGTYSNQRSASSAAPAGEMDSTEVIYLPTAQGMVPVAAQINGRLYAIHADHLSTPRRLTNQQGQVAWQWLLTGFGEVSPTTGARGYVQADSPVAGSLPSYAPEVTFNLRYPGQQWDEETQLSYNVNRYYGPQEGRYIQADPIGLAGGWNRFGYVGGNPLNGTDRLGLYESSPWLRAFVPGQVTFDHGMTAWENGNYGQAGLLFGAMLGEQALSVVGFRVPPVVVAPVVTRMAPVTAEAGATCVPEGIKITSKGLNLVEQNLSRFDLWEPNAAMVQRLRDSLQAGERLTGADANFYLHEIAENTGRLKGLGYDEAHAAALNKYGVSNFSIYHPEVIQNFPSEFNNAWRSYWGIK
ncbi:RHS repeat-associated core domain-containing protein [Comamonas odontotermitis]|uniref:RHS repeat-associated core domain-containing protein n=1 Tax=Comamonas odontotermitis TaxID=379895 RepID=UPI0036732944